MPSDEDVTQRAGSVRAITSLTEQESEALLPHFAHALVAYPQDRTIDGQRRPSRRRGTSDHCPLPIMADTQLFTLMSVKQHPMQDVPGQLFGMF
jgi:hypothetical protein